VKLSNLLVVSAVIGAVFGVAFVAASGPFLALYASRWTRRERSETEKVACRADNPLLQDRRLRAR
jgi:hypothetical protein